MYRFAASTTFEYSAPGVTVTCRSQIVLDPVHRLSEKESLQVPTAGLTKPAR